MGQYHLLVNLDKLEHINPHRVGNGLKLREQAHSEGGIMAALWALLTVSNGRGGGDFGYEDGGELYGRWAGDRIALVGDYADLEDMPAEFDAGTLYDRCGTEEEVQASAEGYLPKPGQAPDADYLDKAARILRGSRYTEISDLVIPFLEHEFELRIGREGPRWATVQAAEDAGATDADYDARRRAVFASLATIGVRDTDLRHEFVRRAIGYGNGSVKRLRQAELDAVLLAVDLVLLATPEPARAVA